MMMPLTKPPPSMTTFFQAYGPGVVVSSTGMPASPEYGTGGANSQVAAVVATGPSDALDGRAASVAFVASTHATELPSHAATAAAIVQLPLRAPAAVPVLSERLMANIGEQGELT